jgi:tRNA A-37 threonylcarbamoyl transferase component Bud32
MKKVELPAYFSALNKGKITLYVKKEYEHSLSAQDMDKLFNLHKDADKLNVSYHGRTPCKTILMESLNNESFVVRDYWHGGLFGKILRDFFWDRLRPLKELSICEVASKSGVKTTEVIAIVKNKIIGPLYKCRLVSKEITSAIDLMVLLLNPEKNQFVAQKRQIINKVAKAVKEMHDAGIYHADLHLKNILVQFAEDGKVNVYIIDLDKSRQREKISLHKKMKNIMRLDRSLEKFKKNVRNDFLVTNTDKMRFLREYIKLVYNTEQHSSVGQKEFLRTCLMNYRTNHKFHRFWWLMMDGRC